MKGIVIKTDESEAIVLTRDRRFVRVPYRPGLAVGQETEVPPQRLWNAGDSRRWKMLRTWGWAAAAAVVLLAGIGWRLFQGAQIPSSAYAYVTVDSDQAVEFAIDESSHVTDLRVIGHSGQAVDPGGLKGLPVSEAVAAWVHRAVAQQRIRDGGEVFIATTPGDRLPAVTARAALDHLNREVAYAVADAVKKDLDLVHVDALQVPEEIRKKALAQGMSPGRYYLYTMAKDRGMAVNLEEFRSQSLAALFSNHRELMGLLQQIQEQGSHRDQWF
ncbi:MAG: anti-sigma factor domain-containing protein [Kyrpidia tusciae]|nr:anti-sigma factor domain-containing protein [Kyrpidia tusciae]MBE3552091.1 anti-sigma factor domain-containing protein [Kyrpidia tusciae]